jgi:predicted lipoprotein with Yx(FWY)xxD motif
MRNAKLIVPALVILVAALLIGVFTAVSMGGNHDKRVVKTAKVGGKTILVNRNGMTLYHLSVERRGHFICTTGACLHEWHPLVIARGVTPTGVKSLSVVKRPDGRRQVAYKGGPLYTFDEDKKAGDMNGDGFMDVGTWHVISVAGKAAASTPSSGNGGYGGGLGY